MLSIDTNLLFYAYDEHSPFQEVAYDWLKKLSRDENVVISELVLTEFYRLLRNPTVMDKPFSAPQAAEAVLTYRQHPRWRLVGLPPDSRSFHDELWDIAGRRSFPAKRLYDSRITLSLLSQGVTEFATANIKDFKVSGFRRVWNPLA